MVCAEHAEKPQFGCRECIAASKPTSMITELIQAGIAELKRDKAYDLDLLNAIEADIIAASNERYELLDQPTHDELATQVRLLRQATQALESQLSSARQLATDLQGKVKDQEVIIERLSKASRVIELEGTIDSLRDRSAKLETALATAQGERASLKADIAEYEAAIQAFLDA